MFIGILARNRGGGSQPIPIPTWGLLEDITFVSSSTVSLGVGWKPYGICFSSDYNKVWTIDNGTDTIYEQSLTDGDPTTLSAVVTSLNITAQVSDPTGIAINSTGTKIFVGGAGIVQEYNLPTPNSLVGTTIGNSFSLGTWKTFGLHFNNDFTQMYGCTDSAAGGSDTGHQWDLSVAEDVTSAVLTKSHKYNAGGALYDFLMYPDGKSVLALNAGSSVEQYTLDTEGDIEDPTSGSNPSTANSQSSDLGLFDAKEAFINCVLPNYEGTKIWIMGQTGKKLHLFNWGV